jgi:hypothetical protein
MDSQIINVFDDALERTLNYLSFTRRRDRKKLSEAGEFPGIKLYDILYSGCFEDGFSELVVVGVDSDGHCQVVEPGFSLEYENSATLAGPDAHRTMRDAIKSSAESDIEYHGPRLEFAKRALAAIEAGSDLSEFEEAQNF